jgi:uncharacterized protein (TIGR00288 family)
MKTQRNEEKEHALAVFIDFENLAHGFNGRRDRFEITRVLERLVEKGKIVVKKAYCDWSRFGTYTGPLHEAAIELIEIPKRSQTGKNSADIRLVVDAIDLAYSKDHIDTFCIVSGDSDFSPLVSKLKELGKHVIGLGLANATSELLRDNCDEFIYYEDLKREQQVIKPAVPESVSEQKQKMFSLLMDSLLALRRENKELIYSSMVKDTMKRKKPSFNEGYYGYNTFSELLEDAQKQGLLDIEKSKSSGTYVVVRFGNEPKTPKREREESAAAKDGGRDRGGRNARGRGRGDGRGRAERPAKPLPATSADDDAAEDLNDVPTYRPRVAAKPAEAAPVAEIAKPIAKAAPVAEIAKSVTKAAPVEPAREPKPREEAPRRRPAAPVKEQPKTPPMPPEMTNGFGAGLDLE